jgi:hypothetical protein
MAKSVPKGFLASLHAERLLRGKQHAKTAPLPASATEVSGLATNEASPIEVKPQPAVILPKGDPGPHGVVTPSSAVLS